MTHHTDTLTALGLTLLAFGLLLTFGTWLPRLGLTLTVVGYALTLTVVGYALALTAVIPTRKDHTK